MIGFSRLLSKTIIDRNKYIENALVVANQKQRPEDIYQPLAAILQMLTTIADSECVNAMQLFDMLLKSARDLEKLNATYKAITAKSRFVPTTVLNETMDELRKITDRVPSMRPVSESEQKT